MIKLVWIIDLLLLKGKPSSQAFNFTNRSTSSSRFGQEFPMLQEKLPFSNGLYGSSSTTQTQTTNARFPIGTFSIDSHNMFNNSSSGDSTLNNSVFSNGNSSNSYNDSNSSNLGTRETGIIEKLLVRKRKFDKNVFN